MITAGEYLAGTITKCELLSEGHIIGNATAFFLRDKTQWHLVTNWHVLSGRNPDTGQPHRNDGAIPKSLRYYSAHLLNNVFSWEAHEIELVDPKTGHSLWKMHPIGQSIDIACVPVASNQVGLVKDLLEAGGNRPNMWLSPGMDVLIPGFPLGISSNGLMPIWKRASLASSLGYGHSLKWFFYVDTATRTGMSGAPCIAVNSNPFWEIDPKTGKANRLDLPLSWRFLGVYSGRLNPSDSFEAQIGIVWRESLVLDLLSKGINGDYILKT